MVPIAAQLLVWDIKYSTWAFPVLIGIDPAPLKRALVPWFAALTRSGDLQAAWGEAWHYALDYDLDPSALEAYVCALTDCLGELLSSTATALVVVRAPVPAVALVLALVERCARVSTSAGHLLEVPDLAANWLVDAYPARTAVLASAPAPDVLETALVLWDPLSSFDDALELAARL